MISTKALSSFKSIFHPVPSPIDSKASKKILKTITSSFRTALDSEHGASLQGRAPHGLPPIPPHLTMSPLPATSIPPAPKHREQPTDRHMRAILTNPLFGPSDPKTSKKLQGTTQEEIFAMAVAKGLMTVPRAHGFLLRVKQDIRQSSALSVEDGMRESGAGLLVVRWLRASGEERQLSFLADHPRFTFELVRFMVAEKLDELAWSWLQRLANGEGPKSGTSILFNALVSAKSEAFRLDAAYSSFLKGDSLLRAGHSRPATDITRTWHALAQTTTIGHLRHKAPVAALYDSFVDVGHALPMPKYSTHLPHLALHHPTQPSPELAVKFLSDTGVWLHKLPREIAAWMAVPSKQPASTVPFVKNLLHLSVDAAEHLKKIGEVQEARRIIKTAFIHLGNKSLQLDLTALEREVWRFQHGLSSE